MPQPKNVAWIGLSKETVSGTFTAPVDWLPVTALDAFDNIHYLPDKGLRGSAVETYGQIAAQGEGEISFSGDVFPESIPRVLIGLLGEQATGAAVSGVYPTNINVLNTTPFQPPTYSVTVSNGFNYRSYTGVLFSELAFKFAADGLMTYSCKGLGFLSSVQAGPFTPVFNAQPPIASWNGSLTFAAVADTHLESIDITINRPVSPIHNIATTQSPYKIWAGAVKCAGKAVFIYEDDATELTKYLTGAPQVAVAKFTTGAAATLRGLTFTMSKLLLINPTKPVWSKDYVELDATFEAVANTVDVGASAGYSPVRVLAQSLVASYTT